MLDPFLDPAIAVSKSKIAFGDLASSFPEKQEQNCTIALNIIRTAVRKPAVLPSLESEWRNGSVAPRYGVKILSCGLSFISIYMEDKPKVNILLFVAYSH